MLLPPVLLPPVPLLDTQECVAASQRVPPVQSWSLPQDSWHAPVATSQRYGAQAVVPLGPMDCEPSAEHFADCAGTHRLPEQL